MVELIAETDEGLMERYLEDEEISVPELKAALRSATLDGTLVPVLCGSALKNKGVQRMLDAVIDYLPSPLDVPPVEGINPKTEEVEIRTVEAGQPFSGLVFKIQADPHVGKLAYIRIYSGTMDSGSYALNSTKGDRERVGRLLKMHANSREEVQSVTAGDICAIIGLKTSFTGDTLCDPDAPIVLENITFPEPVISVSIEPKTRADQDKMGGALGKLAEEDPTFRVRTNEETGQTLIDGMGELHLEVIVDRLMREFKVDANVGRPQVAYKETITIPVRAEGRHVRQTGGAGQYGHCVVEFEPQERGAGYEFVDKIVGGAIPREYINSVDQGIRESLISGGQAGFPLVDLKATLVDGSYHDVDSKEVAYKIAGSLALKDAVRKGAAGQCSSRSWLSKSRRQKISWATSLAISTPAAVIFSVWRCAPVRRSSGRTFRWPRCLVMRPRSRSATQGRATYSMEFEHYAPLPAMIQEEMVAKTNRV